MYILTAPDNNVRRIKGHSKLKRNKMNNTNPTKTTGVD